MKNEKYKIGVIALAFAVILVMLAFAGCASAKTITVPDDYSTIQGAVNAADPADTIYVRSGVYIEHVTVGKSLTLTGEDKETTIIDGSGSGKVIHVTADNVDISEFTVQNGKYGIQLSSNYGTISNNIISNHIVGVSGDGYLYGYNSIIDCSITSCTEGILLCVGHHNTYENCSVSYCSTGFRVCWGDHNLLKDCKAWDCTGWGIVLDSCQYTRVENCDVWSNDAGIVIYSCGAAMYNTITDCNVYLNGIGILTYDQEGRGHGRYNKICHNNIVNNIQYQAMDGQYYSNEWDDGYPSGGNYWNDYTGVDIHSGPNQDISGSDGIGDTPYDISGSAGAQDRYPLYIAIQATVTIKPESLNLKSKGKWVTCYIELPDGYSVEDIDIDSVALTKINGDLPDPPLYTVGPSGIGDYDDDGIPDLMVKFDSQELIPLLEVGDAELTVAGELYDGPPFEGTDTIRVMDKGKGK
ncbi:MAG: hypothetical protein KAT65_12865 [Methanophagales archaeon]|nr:hypothetical protein [Methanophagales archaeon]